ncbi:MAG: tRNA uridine-5-carboxymethylaminomethyl(34) synthesis GTPase MnmE, partial [Desulfovibrionaceae bacterium]|nr:tRNA uridine-5-carboxymethylaminomethyl(34) synthesis GTPase MnmE [Desulfovibrionaceae bacterium]
QYELDLLAQLGPQKFIGVANKCDLAENRHNFWPYGETLPEFEDLSQIEWIDISAKFSEGIERLSKNIRARLLSQAEQSAPSETGWNIAPNLRQAQVLEMARAEGEGILNELEQNVPYDLIGVRVELMSAILAEVSGEIAAEDVLDRIFAEFCLGK